ncbi:MAG: hypothetical protein ACI9VS_004206 [Candidatus Binatia bacterium]|jgi:hypothetical protein
MEGFGLQVILQIGFGALCAALAHSRGRTPVGWFFIGFFLSCIGLIIILVLPNVKEEEAKHAALDDANRSLRERLRQEQMKNEAFRQHAAQRLDAHDRQLDVDTRQTGDFIGDSENQPLQLGADDDGSAADDPIVDAAPDWYFVENGGRVGPHSRAEMVQLIQNGRLVPATQVWCEDLEGWMPLSQTPHFQSDLPYQS